MTKTQITFDRAAFEHAMHIDLLLIKAQAVCSVITGIALWFVLFS